MTLTSLLLSTTLMVAGSASSIKPETVLGADFSSGIYTYRLTDRFYESPNTIEAWIRLGRTASSENGGVIFGNYCEYNSGSVNLEVNSKKNVVLRWNSNEVEIVFDKYVLPFNSWTHIGVVRDTNNQTFRLYVNGLLVQTINRHTGTEPVSSYNYIIGGDLSNWHDKKTYFRGEISQVTVYRSELDSHQIYEDYIKGEEIDYHNRDNLLFNGVLNLNDTFINDTSRYANHAKLISNDYFYKGDLFSANDYTFSIIPDPQMISNHRRDMMHYLGDYLLKEQENQKISLAMCVGDNADASGHWDEEFGSISNELARLDGKIMYTTVPGNHDYDNNCTESRSLSWYNKYYSQERIEKYSYYGGIYQEGHTENSYYLFNQSGVDYLIMCLEFGVDSNVLEWANEVVSQHPNHRVIVTTHGLIDSDGEYLDAPRAHSPTIYSWNSHIEVNDGSDIFNKFLRKHENIFMVFCGHIPTDDITIREDLGEKGNVFTTFLVDAQGMLNNAGCELMLGMFNFDELNQQVSVNYVSAITGELYNIQNQFTYSFKGHTKILSSIYYQKNGELKSSYRKQMLSSDANKNIALIGGASALCGAGIYLASKTLSKKRGKIYEK